MKPLLGSLLLLVGIILGGALRLTSAQTPAPCPTIHPIFQTATALARATSTTVPLQALPTLTYPTRDTLTTPTPQPSAPLYHVTVAAVNIRSQPNTGAFVAGLLPLGTVVGIERTTTIGAITWGQLADGRGWVALQQGTFVYLVKL